MLAQWVLSAMTRRMAGENSNLISASSRLPARLRADFAAQVAIWTDDEIGSDMSGKYTIARSAGRAWHYRSRAPFGNGPDGLGAYLGKAEPSWRRRYGRMVPNLEKPDRWQNGGSGPIQGKRFGISRPIGDTAQAAAA
jgi:hypothetical protein